MKKISLFSLFALVSCVAFSQWSWQNQLPQGNKLNCIRAINTSTVYAVGNCGTILKTTNGGTNWVILNPGISADLLSAFFIHADTGYAVGAAGVILKTVNGGADWIALTSGSQRNFYSVFFYRLPNRLYYRGIRRNIKNDQRRNDVGAPDLCRCSQ